MDDSFETAERPGPLLALRSGFEVWSTDTSGRYEVLPTP